MSSSLNKRSIRTHFNRQANSYDRYAAIQRELADWMFAALPAGEASVQRILEIGCGTGYVTERLVSRFPNAKIVAVDLAPAMLEIAAARVGQTDRVLYLEHDIEQPLPDAVGQFLGVPPSGAFDIIISSGTLQWLDRPEETLRLLGQVLHPQGHIHGGIFGAETFKELREAFKAASQGQGQWTHGPTLRTPEEWTELYARAGLTPRQVRSKSVREVYPSAYGFLKGIQQSGANNAASSDAICRRPSVIRAMMKEYGERFGAGEGVYATWEFVCITAGSTPAHESQPQNEALLGRTH